MNWLRILLHKTKIRKAVWLKDYWGKSHLRTIRWRDKGTGIPIADICGMGVGKVKLLPGGKTEGVSYVTSWHAYEDKQGPPSIDYRAFENSKNIQTYVNKKVAEILDTKERPVLTEPIIGYRVWDYKDGYLQSCVYDTAWPYRKAIDRDIYNDLGIHAVKDYKRVPVLMAEYRAKVAGAIYMWGEVHEKTEGYLSEFAYPKELYVSEDTDPLTIMQLEHDYGVPVIIREELNYKKLAEQSAHIFGNGYSYTYAFTASNSILSALKSNSVVPVNSGLSRQIFTCAVDNTIDPTGDIQGTIG